MTRQRIPTAAMLENGYGRGRRHNAEIGRMNHQRPEERSANSVRRVEAALAEGRLWRAKEILQGALRDAGYDPTLYEQYGLVLLRMGDMVEAGKYLFLSGRRAPEYREAIELFLKRHGRRDWPALAATLPRQARRAPVDAYPYAVRRELAARGIPITDHRDTVSDATTVMYTPAKPSPTGQLLGVGCIVFALVCMVIGFIVVIQTVGNWLQ